MPTVPPLAPLMARAAHLGGASHRINAMIFHHAPGTKEGEPHGGWFNHGNLWFNHGNPWFNHGNL